MHWEGEEMVSCQLLISLRTCGSVWLCKIDLRPVTSDSIFSWNLIWGQLQNWDLKRVFVKGKSQTTPSLSLSLSFFFFLAFVECVVEN